MCIGSHNFCNISMYLLFVTHLPEDGHMSCRNMYEVLLLWFQASAAMLMKSVVFWVFTRRHVVIIYRRFGTTYRSHPHGSIFQVGKKAYNIGTAKHSGVARRVMWRQLIGRERSTRPYCVLVSTPLSRPIGCRHITRLATPLCFAVPML
jgi:hypothetical protein